VTYIRICLAFVMITLHLPVYAYTGPGLGMGIFSIAVGVLGSIFLGILAVVWYPIKRIIRILRTRPPRLPKDSDPLSDQ
jgi:hypothetical protein